MRSPGLIPRCSREAAKSCARLHRLAYVWVSASKIKAALHGNLALVLSRRKFSIGFLKSLKLLNKTIVAESEFSKVIEPRRCTISIAPTIILSKFLLCWRRTRIAPKIPGMNKTLVAGALGVTGRTASRSSRFARQLGGNRNVSTKTGISNSEMGLPLRFPGISGCVLRGDGDDRCRASGQSHRLGRRK